ncbi:hypothetical protein KKH03_01615 [Patescibacteria group bacterium]|nr:hypothetical protein [Patescibacteria group bacterium]
MVKSEYQKVAAEKKAAKARFIKEGEGTPLLVIFAPHNSFGRDAFYQLLEGLLILPGRVVVISDDEHADASNRLKGKVTWVNTKEGRNSMDTESYLMAADMALVFEEHMHELENLMAKGVVVIGHDKSPFLENYKPVEETGNGFTFEKYGPWEIFRALIRAHETYVFTYDWQHIVRGVLKR